MTRTIILAAALLALPVAAAASSAASYAALDKRSAAACIKAAGLKRSRVGPVVRFPDTMLIDARIVSGIWPQRHMNNAPATMLCLYNRKTGAVDAQEAAPAR